MNPVLTVNVRVSVGRRGRKHLRCGIRTRAKAPDPIPRVARVLALAHRWNDLVHSGGIRDRAELARLVGVSRARVTQVMRLLDLAPDIQEVVLDAEYVGPEKALREVARHLLWTRQRVMFGNARKACPSSLACGAIPLE